MKIGKILTIAIALLVFASTVKAQDIHFSQFYASPLNMNPATTGVMTCQMRVSAIYRNQWASVLGGKAFNTFSAGVEGKFPVGRNDFWGGGLNLWADKAGTSKFSSVSGSLSASYLKKIGGSRSNEHYLVAGAQIGVSQRGLNPFELAFGSQFNGDQYDNSLPSNEVITNARRAYADLSAGILWFSALDKDNNSNFYIGAAFSHLTKANISHILEGSHPLFTKYTVHAGGEFRLARRFGLVPAFAMWVQGPSLEMNTGTAVRFDLSKRSKSNQAFQVGAFVRLANMYNGVDLATGNSKARIGTDALIVMTRMRFGSHHIGFSYDVNISKLRAGTKGNGAIELSYVYTLCQMRGRKLGCPSF